jgi:hypothetical protein
MKLVNQTFQQLKNTYNLDWTETVNCEYCKSVLTIDTFERIKDGVIAEWKGEHTKECPPGACYITMLPIGDEEYNQALKNAFTLIGEK